MAGPIVFDVRGMPELVWQVRHEVAKMLRRQADREPEPTVGQRLRDIAAAYESGQGNG